MFFAIMSAFEAPYEVCPPRALMGHGGWQGTDGAGVKRMAETRLIFGPPGLSNTVRIRLSAIPAERLERDAEMRSDSFFGFSGHQADMAITDLAIHLEDADELLG